MGTGDLIHDEIWRLLEANAGIQGLVGTAENAKLYRGIAPEGAGYPHISWIKAGGGDENDVDKEGLNLVYLVSGFSEVSPKQAETLADYIKAALHRKVLIVAGFVNFWTRVEAHVEAVPFDDKTGKPSWQAGRFVRIRFAA